MNIQVSNPGINTIRYISSISGAQFHLLFHTINACKNALLSLLTQIGNYGDDGGSISMYFNKHVNQIKLKQCAKINNDID